MKSQFSEWGKAYPWGRPVRWLLAIALVVALAWVLAETVWLLLYGPNDPIPATEKTRLEVASSSTATCSRAIPALLLRTMTATR